MKKWKGFSFERLLFSKELMSSVYGESRFCKEAEREVCPEYFSRQRLTDSMLVKDLCV